MTIKRFFTSPKTHLVASVLTAGYLFYNSFGSYRQSQAAFEQYTNANTQLKTISQRIDGHQSDSQELEEQVGLLDNKLDTLENRIAEAQPAKEVRIDSNPYLWLAVEGWFNSAGYQPTDQQIAKACNAIAFDPYNIERNGEPVDFEGDGIYTDLVEPGERFSTAQVEPQMPTAYSQMVENLKRPLQAEYLTTLDAKVDREAQRDELAAQIRSSKAQVESLQDQSASFVNQYHESKERSLGYGLLGLAALGWAAISLYRMIKAGNVQKPVLNDHLVHYDVEEKTEKEKIKEYV